MIITEENILLEKRILRSITSDVSRTAEAVGLVYVTSNEPGFTRIRRGSGFIYMDGDNILSDEDQLERIRRLVLPPAWENVWISKKPEGHLQATGIDKMGRKQYRYHSKWMFARSQTKFFRLREFGEKLPMIRAKLEKDLSIQGFPQNKVLAAMVSLMERVNIHVGNTFYERLYGSFGLTTLKDHHVSINGTKLRLMFRGKKGVAQNINLSSRKLAKIIQCCKDIPGKELFQYYDEEGSIKSVDSGMVNNYIREISGSDFTAKDFRTWAGTIQALLAFREVGGFSSQTGMNKKIAAALDLVAKKLGNTRAVCKKYYVHPVIISLYQEKKLDRYLKELDNIEEGKDENGYAGEERILMRILRSPVM
ncbi:MAG TPA: DNA topoisomerase IB [Bacteroidales bacterium]|nr:DNA topoisomerase IB [Bacteroidales bacterium]